MKAISGVKYTEDGIAYQCVLLSEDELKRSFRLVDLPLDVEFIPIPFHPLPFPPESEPESK